ncbi:MAG: hypothetical protein U5K77_02430 [Candidatus Saccharibacteria bacterium]|nr:hypothetical protein [Candidatus Saccharibacteria bacterium]
MTNRIISQENDAPIGIQLKVGEYESEAASINQDIADNPFSAEAEDTPESVQYFDEAAATIQKEGGIEAHKNRYGGDPSKCPFIGPMGAAGLKLAESIQNEERNPDRGKTIGEILAEKRQEQKQAKPEEPSASQEASEVDISDEVDKTPAKKSQPEHDKKEVLMNTEEINKTKTPVKSTELRNNALEAAIQQEQLVEKFLSQPYESKTTEGSPARKEPDGKERQKTAEGDRTSHQQNRKNRGAFNKETVKVDPPSMTNDTISANHEKPSRNKEAPITTLTAVESLEESNETEEDDLDTTSNTASVYSEPRTEPAQESSLNQTTQPDIETHDVATEITNLEEGGDIYDAFGLGAERFNLEQQDLEQIATFETMIEDWLSADSHGSEEAFTDLALFNALDGENSDKSEHIDKVDEAGDNLAATAETMPYDVEKIESKIKVTKKLEELSEFIKLVKSKTETHIGEGADKQLELLCIELFGLMGVELSEPLANEIARDLLDVSIKTGDPETEHISIEELNNRGTNEYRVATASTLLAHYSQALQQKIKRLKQISRYILVRMSRPLVYGANVSPKTQVQFDLAVPAWT